VEPPCHRYECEVAFADTDASGWVHFSKALIYVERAEHDFLRKLGVDVFDRAKGGWPRVKVSCEYKRPLVFQERIAVLLTLDHVGGSSLVWKFQIMKAHGELAAHGEMVTVKVNAAGEVAGISEADKNLLEASA
jgi:YbgC/YbaW family acyl-CoA thioester hydrolase